MSYLPLQQQQPPPPPPPPVATTHQAYVPHGGGGGGGSIGPVIAALALVAVLGVIAGIVGRLCAGRSIFGRGHYDLEGWMNANCSSCIDGTIDSSPQPKPAPLPDGAASQSPPQNGSRSAEATQP
ncbi:unnamed protein product [Spirodela intermedia]|uniref:Uncharacterized protein n=1 Tax=Spirodela intermedia TaxID=51605 RepID=A0A7I8J1A0_SPIIN|nr:unnamed protein product [Spirodela intermedia]CAA6663090.1 unnamed protein product [Spirodela intermedia]